MLISADLLNALPPVLLHLLDRIMLFDPLTLNGASLAYLCWLAFSCPIFLALSNSDDDLRTIIGLYSYASNPCTTKPCLPGMVYAVLADSTYYYITVQGHFLSENQSWGGYTPELGASVTITGYLSNQEDINGDNFIKVELISLQPAT